jgi:FixJ family two-component response regulator
MTTQTNRTIELAGKTQLVAVIDDDDSFRAAVVRMLEASGRAAIGYRCAGEYLLAAHSDCSCIVLDMLMPGPSGLDLLESLASCATSPPVVFVTGYGDIPSTVRAIKAGAVDFLTKPIGRDQLLSAVDRAFCLDEQRRKAWRELEDLRARYAQLSAAEREVFAGVVSGKLNKQLAGTLGICERSIKSSRARVMRKMGAISFADLIKTARLLGVTAARTSSKKPADFAPHRASGHTATSHRASTY